MASKPKRMTNRREKYDQPHPPQIIAPLSLTKTIRYRASGPISGTIFQGDLMHLISIGVGTAGTPSALSFSLCDGIRLKKIELWAPPVDLTVANTLGGSFLLSITDTSTATTFSGPSRTKEDFSLGLEVGHLVWRPVKGSLQGVWSSTATIGGNPILVMVAPQGTIMDVTVDLVIGDGTDPPVALQNFAGAVTAGQVYFRRFGVGNTVNWIPQAVQYAA